MSDKRGGRSTLGLIFRWLLGITPSFAGSLIVYNVVGDRLEIERTAALAACADQGPSCEAMMLRWDPTPITQTLEMNMADGSLLVRCRRSYYLVGDWRCESLGSLRRPGLSASASNALPFPGQPSRVTPVKAMPTSLAPTKR